MIRLFYLLILVITMASLDNQDNNIFPLTLDNLNYISIDGINFNNQSGVVQALNDGSLYADYNVNLDQITPASLGNTIDIAGNTIINNSVAINGAILSASYGANIGGDINISGNYFINGAPLAFSGSNWTIKATQGIYRNSNVGIGDFSALNATLYYDLQLGPINTSATIDKTLSIPVANNRTARIKLTESGPSAGPSEAGCSLAYNGLNDRFELFMGSNATPQADFTSRVITIDRTTTNMSIGSVLGSVPLNVYGPSTVSKQLQVQGASNASLGVVGATGSLELCSAGATGNFSTDANRYDSVIRSGFPNTSRLMLQVGQGRSAILIDSNNNVGVGVASNLTNAMTISGSLAVTNNNIFILGNTSGVQLGPGPVTIKNGIFSDSTLNGLQIFSNNNQALRIDSNANISVGGTNPVTGQRLRIDGNLNVQGGQYLLNGVTLNTSNIPEGSNLYYTDSRARQAISVSSSSSITLTYNNSLGVISASIASTSGYSNWTLDPNNNIYRNSLVGINTTFVNTTHALSIGLNSTYNKGIYIESNYIGTDEQIIRYKNISGGVDYYQNFDYLNGFENHVLNLSAGLYNNFGVDKDNYFYTRNPNGGGVGMKFYSPTMGATQGATIFYEGGANGALNIIHGDNGGSIELWTNLNGTVDERWRISASGSLNNIKSSIETNALRVSGNIFFDNGQTRINNLILTANSIVSSGTTSTLRFFVTGSSGLTIDSLNNISCSGFNFAPLNRQQIFSLTSLNGGLSYLSASFYKVYTTSNIHLEINTNCFSTVANQNIQLIPYLHSVTGAYMNRLACTQYYFSINPASVHFHPSFTRLCLNLTGGQFYTIRFLYSGSGIATATSNQLFGIVTEVPL